MYSRNRRVISSTRSHVTDNPIPPHLLNPNPLKKKKKKKPKLEVTTQEVFQSIGITLNETEVTSSNLSFLLYDMSKKKKDDPHLIDGLISVSGFLGRVVYNPPRSLSFSLSLCGLSCRGGEFRTCWQRVEET
jgi:hypothetical protein